MGRWSSIGLGVGSIAASEGIEEEFALEPAWFSCHSQTPRMAREPISCQLDLTLLGPLGQVFAIHSLSFLCRIYPNFIDRLKVTTKLVFFHSQ